jgi:hydroxymethylpyrimidine pyrophosphatase-like HAD family hydrolase
MTDEKIMYKYTKLYHMFNGIFKYVPTTMAIIGILLKIQFLFYWSAIFLILVISMLLSAIFFCLSTKELEIMFFCSVLMLEKSIFIFDLDGTLTVDDEIPKYIEEDLFDIYEYISNSIIIINSGSDLKRMLKKLSFFDKFVKEKGKVFLQAEQGLITIDHFTKEIIIDPIWQDAETNPLIMEKIIKLFVDYNDLIPYTGQNLEDDDELVCDVEGNKLILSTLVKSKTVYPIGYIGLDKQKMKVIELFRDKNRKIFESSKAKQNNAIKEIQSIAKKNNINIFPAKCSTSIDLMPVLKKIPYSKSQGIGFLLSYISKAKEIPIKDLIFESIAFGDGIADFGMQFPQIGKKKLGRIDMIYCGDQHNYKYGDNIAKVEATATAHHFKNAQWLSWYLHLTSLSKAIDINKEIREIRPQNQSQI